MEFSAPITIITPAGLISMNREEDVFRVTKLDGFDDPELRITVDKGARTDGGRVHSAYNDVLYGTVEGYIRVGTVVDRNAWEHFLVGCINSIRREDGTFQILEAGQPWRELKVRKYNKVVFAPEDGIIHTFQFQVVAADPVWT